MIHISPHSNGKRKPNGISEFSVVDLIEYRIVLENKEMNDPIFIVDEERVQSFCEEKITSGNIKEAQARLG